LLGAFCAQRSDTAENCQRERANAKICPHDVFSSVEMLTGVVRGEHVELTKPGRRTFEDYKNNSV